jgi:hypothetical protein
MFVEETRCRACQGEPLEVVMELGSFYPSQFLESDQLSEDGKAPLVLARCGKCGLVQLKHTVALDQMYREYYYHSGANPSMREALREIIESATHLQPLTKVIWCWTSAATTARCFPSIPTM